MSVPVGSRPGLVVYFTKGVGDVVAAEVAAVAPAASVGPLTDRFVVVEADWPDVERVRAQARTPDDVRLLVAAPRSVPDAAGFAALCEQAAEATRGYLQRVGSARAAAAQPWSVTLSARTPAWRRGAGWDPAPLAARWLGGADLGARSRRPVDVRIQVDGEVMHAAVNLDRPSPGAPAAPVRPGALRRSVAAVLVRLAVAGADPTAVGRGLYDPCCGTGTVVAEAARRGLPVYASDLDPAAVDLTRARLAAPGGEVPVLTPDVVRHRVFVHDLLRGMPQRVDSGLVASNLPWGKQVSVPRRGDLFEACAALAARVVAGGGCCVLLTTHDEQLVARVRRHARRAEVTVRRIGLLGQTPAIVIVRPTGIPTE